MNTSVSNSVFSVAFDLPFLSLSLSLVNALDPLKPQARRVGEREEEREREIKELTVTQVEAQ